MTGGTVYKNLGPCVPHTGYVMPGGYGQVHREGKTWTAHKWAAHVAHGPCPPGQVVRHKCDNRVCINPDHLEYGTYRDNSLDRRERTRYNKLTREDVDRILLLIPHHTLKAIGQWFGVSLQMIHHIKSGKQWS